MAATKISTSQFKPKVIESNFTPSASRYVAPTGTWGLVTNCSMNYTSGPTPETLILTATVMASKSAGLEGQVSLSIDGVQIIGSELYYNPGVAWYRGTINAVYAMPANTTVAIRLYAQNAGAGGSFEVINETAKWMPKITGFAVSS